MHTWKINPLRKLSTEDLSYIKETLSIDEDVSAVLDSAFAFKELGLFSEAGSEYEKLFKLGYPAAEIIPELVQCYLKMYSKEEVVSKINSKVVKEKISGSEKGEVLVLSGIEMEKSGHRDQAVRLYKLARDADPENDEIKEKINVITASLSTGSKYDYLLNENLMNTEQLKQALAMSKKMKKSVEFILIDQHNIKKEDVGKSLSLYYGCPFKSYNEEMPTPVELIGKLREKFSAARAMGSAFLGSGGRFNTCR